MASARTGRSPSVESQRVRDPEQDAFRKRTRTLRKKLLELKKVCKADSYLIIDRKNQYFTIQTSKRKPPTETELVESPDNLDVLIIGMLISN